MLQAALVGLILVAIYRFMRSGTEYTVDWHMAFGFALIPYFLILLLRAVSSVVGLSEGIVLAGYVLYLVVPFLILKLGLDFPTRSALKFSFVVPVVVVFVEISLFGLFAILRDQ